MLGVGNFIGTAGNKAALTLVFGMAVAVTSIPVISRIMHDVGLPGDAVFPHRAVGRGDRGHRAVRHPRGRDRARADQRQRGAIIGIQLDLIHHFDVVFFLGFLAVACVAKAASVYLGARLSRENKFMSASLAIAMNARGGPGIVLASTAYAAGIINQTFFVSLVMLSIVTSLAAGSWLERVADRLAGAVRHPQQDAAEVPGELSAT